MTALDAVALVTERASAALSDGPLDRDQLHAELRRRLPAGLLPYCRGCDSHHVHPSLVYAVALQGRLVVLPRDDGPYLVARFDRWSKEKPRRFLTPGCLSPSSRIDRIDARRRAAVADEAARLAAVRGCADLELAWS